MLDQSPISAGSTGRDALANSIDLARLADDLGYHRYWVAEHHGGPMLAGPAPEVLAARHMGIRCLALSCVTNAAAGVVDEPIDHEQVLEIGARAAGDLIALLREVVPALRCA